MEKLIALLVEASGLPKTALASCVNDDSSLNKEAIEAVIPKIRQGIEAKLTTAKEEAKEEATKEASGKGTFEEGRVNGSSEAQRKLEKRLRETFQVEDSKLSGDELIKAIATNKGTPPKELTQEQVERLPWYQDAKDKRDKEHKEELAKVTKEFNDYKEGASKKDRMDTMWKKAEPIIEELNLNFSPDAHRKAAQMERLRKDLEANDYDIQDKRILILKDGKVLKDDLENNVDFNTHVSKVATSWLDPMESKERKSAGVKTDKEASKSKGAWTKPMPKNDTEYQALMLDDAIPMEERGALMEAWKANS